MKILKFFILSSLLIFSIGCTIDGPEPCIADNLEDTIIGSWTIHGLGSADGDIEFRSDGTLIDDNDVLLGFEDIPDEKSYVVDSNSYITITSKVDGNSATVEFGVNSFTCEEIILDIFFDEIKMTRK